ncbi:hypothetical protein IW261DRAFT_1577955 [Armillaria novae-zelandiae]|uniref:Uncharacterized protein n=1 Tax=Armillaria novae-zelandiae TaxID=153914 RepID=A0AA39N723_9AGAR|nr:hypothetical protein IW261DRAFT_1577955 [Armillaria novae-zelandiae]
MENQMEKMERTLEAIGGRIDNLVDNFEDGSALEYPRNFMPAASVEEWKVSLEELQDLKGETPEALRLAMRFQLDHDIAQVMPAQFATTEFNSKDPFELANIKLWHGIQGEGALEGMIAARMRFRETQSEFCCLGGHWSEWALWKEYLKGGDDFMVEDSEGEFEEEEVWEEVRLESMAEGIAQTLSHIPVDTDD